MFINSGREYTKGEVRGNGSVLLCVFVVYVYAKSIVWEQHVPNQPVRERRGGGGGGGSGHQQEGWREGEAGERRIWRLLEAGRLDGSPTWPRTESGGRGSPPPLPPSLRCDPLVFFL